MEEKDREASPNNSFSQYKKYLRGNLPPSWPDILSKKLNYKLENKGQGGSSNYSIFFNFIKNIDKIQKNDLVIFQWTNILRFRLASYDTSELIDILPNQIYTKVVSKKTIEELIINRDNDGWVAEIIDLTKFLIDYCKAKNIKIIFWAYDDKITNNIDKKIYNEWFFVKKYDSKEMTPMTYVQVYTRHILNQGPTIQDETNNLVDDMHLGQYGHQIIADMFEYVLQKKKLVE